MVSMFKPKPLLGAHTLARIQEGNCSSPSWGTIVAKISASTFALRSSSSTTQPYFASTLKGGNGHNARTKPEPHKQVRLLPLSPNAVPLYSKQNEGGHPNKVLTSKEIKEHWASGLCFWCNKCFMPCHRYP